MNCGVSLELCEVGSVIKGEGRLGSGHVSQPWRRTSEHEKWENLFSKGGKTAPMTLLLLCQTSVKEFTGNFVRKVYFCVIPSMA